MANYRDQVWTLSLPLSRKQLTWQTQCHRYHPFQTCGLQREPSYQTTTGPGPKRQRRSRTASQAGANVQKVDVNFDRVLIRLFADAGIQFWGGKWPAGPAGDLIPLRSCQVDGSFSSSFKALMNPLDWWISLLTTLILGSPLAKMQAVHRET